MGSSEISSSIPEEIYPLLPLNQQKYLCSYLPLEGSSFFSLWSLAIYLHSVSAELELLTGPQVTPHWFSPSHDQSMGNTHPSLVPPTCKR